MFYGLNSEWRYSWLYCLHPTVDSYKYVQYEKYLDRSYINVKNGDMKEIQRLIPVMHKCRVSPNSLNYTGTAKTYGAE